ncbi:MAG: hypothetical protein Q8R26_00330 [bacterium]|nr:hypothetical protein [bacterium]
MKQKKGYLALVTAIIVSFIMLIVSITLGFASFISRDNNLNFLFKKSSYFAARSCLDYALLKLGAQSTYAGNETITIDTYQCAVRQITINGSQSIITVRAVVQGATTNLRLTVVTSDLSTVSLEEVNSF